MGVFDAKVPSGASTGIYEAIELRDKDPAVYRGKGVLNAVNNVNTTIKEALVGNADVDVRDQVAIDKLLNELDGTANKGNLGANAILGVSLAVCRAGAAHKEVPLYQHIADLSNNDTLRLPLPYMNVINGGSHAGSKLAMQEFMILPTGADDFHHAMRIGAEVYHALAGVIKAKYGQDATNVGDEGGFAPNIQDNFEGLNLLVEAIEKAGYTGKVKIGMDVAASEFAKKKDGDDTFYYALDFKNPESNPDDWVTGAQLNDIFASFCEQYPVESIEDTHDQDDWDNWVAFTQMSGETCQVVGDDLLVTNVTRIQTAIERGACNALLLKVNQIGSVTESINAALLAKSAGWGVMVSHRSGETSDTFIADLVVGLGTCQIKTGAPCRSERTAKYNRIMEIAEELGEGTPFAGPSYRTF